MELYKFISESRVKKYNGGFVVYENKIYTNPHEDILKKVGFKPLEKADNVEFDAAKQYRVKTYEDSGDIIKEKIEVVDYEQHTDLS